jgi:hypothetical protein
MWTYRLNFMEFHGNKTKKMSTCPQVTKWPITWPTADPQPIYFCTVIPNRYADIQAKFHGVSWKQNKESVNLPPGDQIAYICPNISPTSKLT